MVALFLVPAWLAGHGPTAALQDRGAIRGSVFEESYGTPLSGARVTLVEGPRTIFTDDNGTFLFDEVAPGSYTVVVSMSGYERQVLSDVIVAGGQLADLRIDLASEVIELEELIVTGTDPLAESELGALEIRSESITLQDSISAELISKSGVSDVAGALKLVVGATVVDGKYATVRGLSDRYTGTTLNGVRVPSADPQRRAVQIDLFPTGTIDNVTVTKTFTPELQGDFTGGGVDIRTKAVPDGLVFSVSGSIEHNNLATGNSSFLTYPGGGVDSFGFDDGSRDLPSEANDTLPKPLSAISFSPNPSPADIEAAAALDSFTDSFRPAMGIEQKAPDSNFSYAVVAGNQFKPGYGDDVVGIMGALTYSHKYDYYEGGKNNRGFIESDASTVIEPAFEGSRTDSKGTDETLLGGLVNAFWQPDPDHKMSLQLIGNQSAIDEARFQVDDQTLPDPIEQQNQSLIYTERTVYSVQFHGDHALAGPEGFDVDWVGAYNFTRQYEPDTRYFRSDFNPVSGQGNKPANSTTPQNTRRIWRDGEEDNLVGGVNVEIPFDQWQGVEAKIKTGVFVDRTDREFTQDSFTYDFASQGGSRFDPKVQANQSLAIFLTEDSGLLWTDVFTNGSRLGYATNNPPAKNQLLWVLQPVGADVNYTGDSGIDAAYAMVELPLLHRLTTIIGARFERTEITIEPEGQFGCVIDNLQIDNCVKIIKQRPSGVREIIDVPAEDAATDLEDETVLPSVNFIYEVVPDMKVRLSWSRTLARPTFREMAPVITEEFILGDEFIGNPDLTLSKIENYDLRWEWFRRPGEVLAASIFYKEIKNPIEMITFGAGGRSFTQPVNFERGEVRGAEIEARTALDVFSEKLSGFTVGMNLTLLDSEVDVPPDEIDSLDDFGLDQETRRLQGQPEFAVNFNVTYDNDRTGTSAAVFYNAVGETLQTGAARGIDNASPDVYERPFGALNVNVEQKLGPHSALSFKAKNILQDLEKTVYRTPDDLEYIKTEHATAALYSLSYKWSW